MTITDFCYAGVEIQSEIVYCYYDYDNEKRVNITRQKAREYDIKYMYCEDNTLYIEVNME